jgi:hypothetical protein
MFFLILRRIGQALTMTGALVYILITAVYVAMVIASFVLAKAQDNFGVDFAFLGISKGVAWLLLLFLFCGGTFWASRLFHWGRNSSSG